LIRVAIADDHAELRVALRLLLSRSEQIVVVCEAADGRQAIECVQQHAPDVLVMDVIMPELDGFATTKELVRMAAPTRVILTSTTESYAFPQRAAAAGAWGFVPKSDLVNSLRQAIEFVYHDKPYFPTSTHETTGG
jgi:DNA-binding NarL/FixJ family response regulator